MVHVVDSAVKLHQFNDGDSPSKSSRGDLPSTGSAISRLVPGIDWISLATEISGMMVMGSLAMAMNIEFHQPLNGG